MKKELVICLILSAQLLSSCAVIPNFGTSSDGSDGEPHDASYVGHSSAPTVTMPSEVSHPSAKDDEFTAEIEEYEYNIPSRYYSEGIKNIVRRARQISEFHWTPLSNVTGFNGDEIFEKGKEVIGLPYGQPVYSGKFIMYGATLEDYAEAAKRPASPLYTDSAKYEEIAPYYSLDCSTMICYAWGLDRRMIASILTQWGDYCGSTISDIQVGDALIAVGDATHAVLVTGVKENKNGEIVWVEITEETPPLAKVTRYGEGEMFSLAEFNTFYFEKDYGVYRNTDFRDGTQYEHSCASPLDGEKCETCGQYSPYRELSFSESADGSIVVNCSYGDNDAVAFGYTIENWDYGTLKYRTPKGAAVALTSAPKNGEVLYSIPAGTIITTTETQTKDGALYGKVRTGGECGWVCLDKCTKQSGTLERTELKQFKADAGDRNSTASIQLDDSELYDGCKVHFYAVKSDGTMREIGKISVKKN